MLKSVAASTLALTLIIVVLAGAVVLQTGGGAGAAAAWVVGLALASRVVPIVGAFAIALWPRRAHRPAPLGSAGLARIVAAEAWATVRLFFFYHPFERLVTRHAPGRVMPRECPVVLVHGFYSNAGFWHPMKASLRAAGWNNLYSLNLEPLFSSIDEYARQLERRTAEACEECGTDSVIVVAHSMGGLVARVCARRVPGCIRHLICLGSPHRGTVLARLVPSITTRQMRIGSDWLTSLNSGDPGVAITNIYSEHDNIIVPQMSAALPKADNIALHGVGHLEMAFSSNLRRTLIDVLERFRPSR